MTLQGRRRGLLQHALAAEERAGDVDEAAGGLELVAGALGSQPRPRVVSREPAEGLQPCDLRDRLTRQGGAGTPSLRAIRSKARKRLLQLHLERAKREESAKGGEVVEIVGNPHGQIAQFPFEPSEPAALLAGRDLQAFPKNPLGIWLHLRRS